MLQIGTAIQISQALGRELILPPIWCLFDNGWSEHNGRVAGTHPYPLPFRCPAGKVFNLTQ